jgi:hypothetical protein
VPVSAVNRQMQNAIAFISTPSGPRNGKPPRDRGQKSVAVRLFMAHNTWLFPDC